MTRRTFIAAFAFLATLFGKAKAFSLCGYVVEQKMLWNNGNVRMDYKFFPLEEKEEAEWWAKVMAYTDSCRTVTTVCYPVYKS